jgi:hypothetical protein
MPTTVEIPFPPRPNVSAGTHMEPPWVPIEPRWEYKEVIRHSESEGLPSEAELNAWAASIGS